MNQPPISSNRIKYAKRRERKHVGGYWVEVKPRCATDDLGYSFCISHQTAIPSPEAYEQHVAKPGTHLLVWICTKHGPEEYFRKATAVVAPKPPTIAGIRCPGCGDERKPEVHDGKPVPLTQADVAAFTKWHARCPEPAAELRACSNCGAAATERKEIAQADGAPATRCDRCGLVERGLVAVPPPEASA